MEVSYGDHAELNLKERKISKKLVEHTLRHPDEILNANYGRKIAQKRYNVKMLRVIFEEEGKVYKVKTAYYTKTTRYSEK